ncbi:MAG: hypothetical protein IKU77_03805 [Alistipes sp.]|nr:hypothetical protein [Alistipes sp.]
MKNLVCVLGLLFAFSLPVAAQTDSVVMDRKAEKEQAKEAKRQEKEAKKQEKEEQKRLAELERLATPHFQGGDIDTFEQWIVANLRRDFGPLPPNTPYVKVEVPFYVEADGSTSLPDEDTTDEHLYPRLVQEIERVILFSPKWDPGQDAFGHPVRSRQVASLTFKHDPSQADPWVIHPTPRPVPSPGVHPKPHPKPQPTPHPRPKPRPGSRRR